MSSEPSVPRGTLLFVDADQSALESVRHALEKRGVRVWTASTRDAAVERVRAGPDLVLLGERLLDGTGLSVLGELRRGDAQLPVVTTGSSTEGHAAIEAMKLGALDHLVLPVDLAQVDRLLEHALEIRRSMLDPSPPEPRESSVPVRRLIGRCPAMQAVYKAIGRIAARNIPVLIRGESGTGKELVARALVEHSDRANQTFLTVNCAAIPDALLESELFGHEKGAFTGAEKRRIGRFEQCHCGTLFFDEIGDMDLHLQSKILRVMQEQRFERVGGNERITTDVRVLAATHRDLEQMVAAGRFREDLFHRLTGYTIFLPPLRERGEDLELLLDDHRRRANHELGKDVRRFHADALRRLREYSWPGNVREMQGVVRRAILETDGPVVLPESLPRSFSPSEPATNGEAGVRSSGLARFVGEVLQQETDGALYDRAVEHMERQLFSEVLRQTGGNQSDAAERLGITRATLRTKLQRLNLRVSHRSQVEDRGSGRSNGRKDEGGR